MTERGGVLGDEGRLFSQELDWKLHIEPGHSVAMVNSAHCQSVLIPLTGDADPDQADVVVGFIAQHADLELLTSVYAAAHADRVAWVGYPKPGRLCSDLHRHSLARAIRHYGVEEVEHISIGYLWSALRLQSIKEE